MKHARQALCVGVLGAMAMATGSAHAASLIGDTVDVVLSGGIVLEDFGIVVGPGVELQGGDPSTAWGAFLFPTESIDIGADTISMAFDTSLGDDAILTFDDLDFGAGIGGVTLISSIPEVTQANVSFTATSITLDLDAWFDAGGAGTLELQLTEVPLPAAAWLFIAALGSLGLTRRRG
ncbi:MAG: VPLPA-CTERM sorting domain-containing protein [Pseudomonadota bacterium]